MANRVYLPPELNAMTVPPIMREFPLTSDTTFVIDMSRVKVIRPAGACFLICVLASAAPISSHRRNYVRFDGLNAYTESFLATLGFFTALKRLVALIGCEEAIAIDSRRRNRSYRNAIDSFWRRDGALNQPLAWPIEIILEKPHFSHLASDFETNCEEFMNRAVLRFRTLFDSGLGFDHVDEGSFWQSNRELYKNIYDHSQSWGLVCVFSQPNHGTVFTYHDIGVGINGSMPDDAKFPNDLQAIQWALQEGNSSKRLSAHQQTQNSGLGLCIVSRMAVGSQGIVDIRSGNCIYRYMQNKWQAIEVNSFPGTHVSVFIPAHNVDKSHV